MSARTHAEPMTAETMGHQPTAPAPAERAGKVDKQAVVLIHGMGEQIPMDTVKGFVRTLWETDPVITDQGLPGSATVWSKPDDRTGSLELRRITTRESVPGGGFPGGVRTDFYELYWADLTTGSTWDQFVSWVRYLLFRPWSRVPRDVRGAWVLLWIASVSVLAVGACAFVPDPLWRAHAPIWLPQKAVVAVFAAAGTALHQVATRTFGRVVRYTRADPDNIASRAAVRKRGLELLRALHKDDSYRRIVLVGHSLGSMLAYDLLSYYWAERADARTIAEGTRAFDALREVERAAGDLDQNAGSDAPRAFAAACVSLRQALSLPSDRANAGRPWLISDLVTLGSPLTHAEFLLANGRSDLDARKGSRELPTAPPMRESLDPSVLRRAVDAKMPVQVEGGRSRLMAFPDPGGKTEWTLHHAAPFAAVRWTNVYDRSRMVLLGDLIGGPIAPVFGPAVDDVDLALVDAPSHRFTHTRYWNLTQSRERIAAFRKAINLLDA